MLFPRTVPKGGDTLDGKFVPEGTQICFDSWSFGRRKDVYGMDAEVFRPERFTEASAEKRQQMISHSDLIFSAGRFKCAGQVMAHLEIYKVIAEVRLWPMAEKNNEIVTDKIFSFSETLTFKSSIQRGPLTWRIGRCLSFETYGSG